MASEEFQRLLGQLWSNRNTLSGDTKALRGGFEKIAAGLRPLEDASFTEVDGKYPPAKPGALELEPLEAAGGVADAAPQSCAT